MEWMEKAYLNIQIRYRKYRARYLAKCLVQTDETGRVHRVQSLPGSQTLGPRFLDVLDTEFRSAISLEWNEIFGRFKYQTRACTLTWHM